MLMRFDIQKYLEDDILVQTGVGGVVLRFRVYHIFTQSPSTDSPPGAHLSRVWSLGDSTDTIWETAEGADEDDLAPSLATAQP